MAKVATVMTDLFEDVEFIPPRDALVKAEHEVVVIGPEAGTTVTGTKEEATVEGPVVWFNLYFQVKM